MQQLFQNLPIKRIIKYDLIKKWNVQFAEKIYLQDKFKNYGQYEIHKNNKGEHFCRSSTRRHERHLWSIFRNINSWKLRAFKKVMALPAHKLNEDLFECLDFLHRVCQTEEANVGSDFGLSIFAFSGDYSSRSWKYKNGIVLIGVQIKKGDYLGQWNIKSFS